MKQILKGIAILAATTLLLNTFTWAEAPGIPVNPPSIIQAQEPLEVLWKERGGEILVETVCFNYPVTSDEHKGCRKLAKKKFSEECSRFRQLYYDSKPYYDKEYEQQMEKYCDADLEFTP
jgi:hypothetical protein